MFTLAQHSCADPARHVIAADAARAGLTIPPVPAVNADAASIAACDAGPAAIDVASGDEPRGCGWYESSHALRHGMQVIEHAGFELLRELPLGWQLAAYFNGEAGAGAALAA